MDQLLAARQQRDERAQALCFQRLDPVVRGHIRLKFVA